MVGSRMYRHAMSTVAAVAFDIPTRHSLMQPSRVCSDLVELQEETERLLQSPVGSLYAHQATAEGGRVEAYEIAYATIQRAEYLQLGHASQVPGSLYDSATKSQGVGDGSSSSNALSFMKPLVARLQQEGEMYLQLRQQKHLSSSRRQRGNTTFARTIEDVSSGDSSTIANEEEAGVGGDDSTLSQFAPPGPTAKMQEALLDVMACVGSGGTSTTTITPWDYYQVAVQILEANDVDGGTNPYTLPTHVTYNAALRGISTCPILSDEAIRDEAMSTAFDLYNHLTHSLHLPRNSATFVYMLQTVNNVFPPSRVKGNICVTLWDHATRVGVADSKVVETLKAVLTSENGPEFKILTDELSKPIPQTYRRFLKKYRHSDNY